jgi:hypothetical protein
VPVQLNILAGQSHKLEEAVGQLVLPHTLVANQKQMLPCPPPRTHTHTDTHTDTQTHTPRNEWSHQSIHVGMHRYPTSQKKKITLFRSRQPPMATRCSPPPLPLPLSLSKHTEQPVTQHVPQDAGLPWVVIKGDRRHEEGVGGGPQRHTHSANTQPLGRRLDRQLHRAPRVSAAHAEKLSVLPMRGYGLSILCAFCLCADR